ncbi:MAG: DUF3124 domain-containing protein [Deltaproteobacteria bacterium]|nr:DUF3124 domain-containing protein [Deltaproteobacteria bacterium]
MKDHRGIRGRIVFWGILFTAGLLAAAAHAATDIRLSKGQTVYVPIYSHIYIGDRDHPYLLAATLSIRNTDPNHSITILSADYYDTDGKLLRRYLTGPRQLSKMASTRFIIKESDKSGGSGAKFIVTWKSDTLVNEPIIEGVMIGTKTQQGISFVCRGRAITDKTDLK